MWVKFTKTSFPSSSPYLWSCGASGSGAQGLYMNNSTMKLSYYGHTSYGSGAISDGALRDLSGWYHFVWSVNSGTGTCYINGVQQSASISNVAPLNAHGGTEMAVHTYCGGTYSTYDDAGALMSHVHFIDGTAYNASTFGSTDSTTGEWKINTSPSVTYGTNGFFLLKDDNAVTDRSGQGNNFTSSGTITKTKDCPSNVFATFNPLDSSAELSYGNTKVETSSNTWKPAVATIGLYGTTGKFYYEGKSLTGNNGNYFGVYDLDERTGKSQSNSDSNRFVYYGNGEIYRTLSGESTISGQTTWANGDIIGIAIDKSAGSVSWYKNGTLLTTQTHTDITNKNLAIGTQVGYTSSCCFNFGNGDFAGTSVTSNSGAGYQDADGLGIFQHQPPANHRCLSTKGLNQ
tara:strand:- start:5569 stop:6774 length:1206 start_codon:yes stop_codon:yes gene_type:complete